MAMLSSSACGKTFGLLGQTCCPIVLGASCRSAACPIPVTNFGYDVDSVVASTVLVSASSLADWARPLRLLSQAWPLCLPSVLAPSVLAPSAQDPKAV